MLTLIAVAAGANELEKLAVEFVAVNVAVVTTAVADDN